MNVERIKSLVGALETKDFSTAAHTWRVVLYTRALAEAADVDHDFVDRLAFAAALHDVGKLDIPDAVLTKPGPLTREEFEVMKTHPGSGHARLLTMGETDRVVLELVRHHHERLDGAGYPDGLKGDAIPRAAAYFAVVDSFDAMTSLRPYRSEIGPDAAKAAIRELRDEAGSRYCADAVKRFAGLFERGDLNWILEYYNDRCLVPDYAELAGAKGRRR